MKTQDEYEALRQEIIVWQERRFTVIGVSTVVVTAIIGWIVNTSDKWSWDIASVLPLSVATSGCYLTWMFGRFNVMIGTYLETFHKSAWERRSRIFRRRHKFLRLNTALGGVYLGLGVLSIVLPYAVCTSPTTLLGIIFFTAVLVLHLCALILLTSFSYPRDYYFSEWQRIKSNEKGAVDT